MEVHQVREIGMKVLATVEIHLPDDKDGYYMKDPQDEIRDIEAKLPRNAVVKKAKYVHEKHDLVREFKNLLMFKVDSTAHLVPFLKKQDGYEKGDETAPFFSEAFLYPLLGKDDARTVLAYIHSLMRELGVDPWKLQREINAELDAKEKEEARRLERVEKRRAFRAEYCKKKGWKLDSNLVTGLNEEQLKEIRKAMQEAGIP